MCGICGKLIFKNQTPDRESIRKMCRMLIHRGPDNEGVYTAAHIGMGQRRLSVIDLSPAACPPLSNEDGSIWIVFNGEIYNFPELRQKLKKKGHRFITNSDSEVVIHQYEEDGIECLSKFRGMFALSIWDNRRKLLFCARDRLGKKPFCYALTSQSFVFGSEIKAITTDPNVSVAPDYHAIEQYLTYQFVPSPLTAFKSIKRLMPGEYLTCDLKGNLNKQQYWEAPLSTKTDANQDEIQSQLLQHLKESVRLRMRSDVPVGAFLSGGIDSAAIVAIMAQESSRPVQTFSIGFEKENELPYARLLADRYSTEHHELIIKPNMAEILPMLVHYYNEPFADASALPTYFLSKMACQHVTVALSGDGGDESFAGYYNYEKILKWNRWDILPLWLRQAATGSGMKILRSFSNNNTAARLNRGLSMLRAPNTKVRRLQYGTIVKPEEKHLVYTPLFKNLISKGPAPEDPLANYPWKGDMDSLDWLMRHDQKFYLPDCLMVKTDIASMANGLEVRSPLLDHVFVEFAASLPSHIKRRGSEGKIIFKNALKDLLPIQIIKKPKLGFSPPIAKWFRNELAPTLKETLLDQRSARRGLFNQSYIQTMVNEHINGHRDWSNRLWAFLFLELWFREFID